MGLNNVELNECALVFVGNALEALQYDEELVHCVILAQSLVLLLIRSKIRLYICRYVFMGILEIFYGIWVLELVSGESIWKSRLSTREI